MYKRQPYRIDNNFLNRYTRTVAQLVDSIDELISTCFQMGEEGWKSNAKFYDEDQYVDWMHVSEKRSTGDKRNIEQFDIHTKEVDVKKIANDILKKG